MSFFPCPAESPPRVRPSAPSSPPALSLATRTDPVARHLRFALSQDPKTWHACSAFLALALAPPGSDDAPRASLTDVLRAFDVACVDFFRALRKVMTVAAAPLDARRRSATAPSPTRASKRRRASAGADETKGSSEAKGSSSEPGASLGELESALRVSELRTSFAFTQVVAQKYKLFIDVHFDKTKAGFRALAKFGWRLFLAAKHSTLPTFPDLYSCYHLLVVVEAFLLVNGPRELLRTDLQNMVSMSVKDDRGLIDALASLSVAAKTKLPTLRGVLVDFQRDVVEGALKTALAKEAPEEGTPAALERAPDPGAGLSPDGPARYLGLLHERAAADAASSTSDMARAASAASAAYASSTAKEAAHLVLDETLYLPLDADEERDALAVLGDVSKPVTAGVRGGVAATPGPGAGLILGAGAAQTPWRGASTMRGVLGATPARLGSKAAYSPYAARTTAEAAAPGSSVAANAAGPGPSAPSPFGGGTVGRAAAGGGGHGSVQFTPVSEAMASAAWLHAIVASEASGARAAPRPEPARRIARFVGEDVAKRLMETVHGLAGKTSAALREDAFLVTINGVAALAGAGHNVSLDKLVRRRQEEAVRVFAYFLELVLEGEQRRSLGGDGGPASASLSLSAAAEAKSSITVAGAVASSGGVADVAALAAETATRPAPTLADPDDAQKKSFRALVSSSRFVRSVLACSMEVVVASYKTATLKFPAIPRLLGLDAFDVCNIIEPFVRADATMPREVKKHFNAIEETIMETSAWAKGSSLVGFLRAAKSGVPPPRPGPAAAALKAVSEAAGGDEASPRAAAAAAAAGPRREPSFSVAGVARDAASPAGASTPAGEKPKDAAGREPLGGGASEDSGEGPAAGTAAEKLPEGGGGEGFSFSAEKGSVAAFSTPLRGATTPTRGARDRKDRSDGLGPVATHPGPDPSPLPRRFVRDPRDGQKLPGDATARNTLRIFFAKVMRTSARRLADLCERLQLPPALTQQAYDLVQHVLYDHLSLLYNRHLDQILLCAVYGVCKVNKEGALRGRLVPFRDVIYHYQKQPQCREEVFWTVVVSQTDPGLEVKQHGDIIQFYNDVFIPEIKTFLLELKGASAANALANPRPKTALGDENAAREGAAPGGPPPPRSPLPAGLQSPRKILGGAHAKQSVYVSPMRSDKAAASHMMTPRSKSLFAFVGETTHLGSARGGGDLGFINRRMAASAREQQREARGSDDGGAQQGVLGVAAEASAMAAPPPAAARRETIPEFPADEHERARPGKAPRRSGLGE